MKYHFFLHGFFRILEEAVRTNMHTTVHIKLKPLKSAVGFTVSVLVGNLRLPKLLLKPSLDLKFKSGSLKFTTYV